jgi:hypothetical protein
MGLLFENEICGRCGGTGSYSFNQLDGSRCYGCGGSKRRLTKRGAEAQRFFRGLLMRRADELQIGDVVSYIVPMNSGATARANGARVIEIDREPKVTMWSIRRTPDGSEERIPCPTISYTTEHSRLGRCGHSCAPDSMIEIRGSDEERKAAIEQALAYQETLTKAGKPAKRKAAA